MSHTFNTPIGAMVSVTSLEVKMGGHLGNWRSCWSQRNHWRVIDYTKGGLLKLKWLHGKGTVTVPDRMTSIREISHYDYLEMILPKFFKDVGVDWESNAGIISAHGDKGYGYKHQWEDSGIPFPEGMAVYLLSYVSPYSETVRETDSGWIDPGQWVIDNYDTFRDHLETAHVVLQN